ncbi:hypothetical protein EB796_000191 [Bugula neritina]|uniref:Ashwin n=1 Tax=Bugula neritina TaxID=10212 RepID=A0A7J7KTJ7_BUGNE|nr:hypothetical protein EB796_000191 [Bugula neritina]
MDTQDLTRLLIKRGVEVERHFDKYKLIDLFYKYVLPLPQRKHRPNRKGLLLAQSQQLLDKLKLVPPTTTNKLMKNHAVKRSALDRNDVPLKKQGLINSPLTSDSNQKVPLKLAVNFKRKVIKLGSSTISTEVQPVTTSTTHSNSTATQKVQTTAEPPEKKARAKITWP